MDVGFSVALEPEDVVFFCKDGMDCGIAVCGRTWLDILVEDEWGEWEGRDLS